MEVPTGGKEQVLVQARERPLRRGQQIRCNSEADGHSPDGREQEEWGRLGRCQPVSYSYLPWVVVNLLKQGPKNENQKHVY